MKLKSVSKHLITILLTTAVIGSVVASADTISLVGKKVQSETSVKIDGVVVDKAIIIDGKSYAPVRSVAEAVGVDVSFVNGEVLLQNNNVVKEPQKPATDGKTQEQLAKEEQAKHEEANKLLKQQLKDEIKKLEDRKWVVENKIYIIGESNKGLENLLVQYQDSINDGVSVEEASKLVMAYANSIKLNNTDKEKLEVELVVIVKEIADKKKQLAKL